MNRKAFHARCGVLLITLCLTLSGCAAKGIPADEWLLQRSDDLETMTKFCEDMDDVEALFLSGAMEKEDYKTELSILNSELSILEQARDDEEIKPGTQTLETKKAQEGYEAIWTDLRDLITALIQDSDEEDDKNRTAYLYMAWQEKIKEDTKTFTSWKSDLVQTETEAG